MCFHGIVCTCPCVEYTEIVITHIFVKRSKEFKCVRRRTSSVQSIVTANVVNVALFFGGDEKSIQEEISSGRSKLICTHTIHGNTYTIRTKQERLRETTT